MNSRVRQLKAIAITITIFFSSIQSIVNVAGQAQNVEASLDQTQILSATVQIRMVTLLTQNENGQTSRSVTVAEVQSLLSQGKGYLQERGLGTVASQDGKCLILTHNHWGQVLLTADLVEIRNAWNDLLVAMTGMEFLSLVRYSDQGTLVLETPNCLSVSPAHLGSANPVQVGQKVFLVRQSTSNPNQVEVVPASAKGTELKEGLDTWIIKTSKDDSITPGDSGGGVWLNGDLIGNLWTTEGVYFPGLWGSEEKLLYTGISRAAQLPRCNWSSFITHGADGVDEKAAPQEDTNGAS